jgi:erythritol transport system permease protein
VGVSAYWQTVFVGAVIVIAVMLNSLEYGRPRRKKKPADAPAEAPADATTSS